MPAANDWALMPYTPAGGDSVTVHVIAKRPDEIVGFGDTLIYTETAVFNARASEVEAPRPGDILMVNGSEYVLQGDLRVILSNWDAPFRDVP
jgi:hypothetical protein